MIDPEIRRQLDVGAIVLRTEFTKYGIPAVVTVYKTGEDVTGFRVNVKDYKGTIKGIERIVETAQKELHAVFGDTTLTYDLLLDPTNTQFVIRKKGKGEI